MHSECHECQERKPVWPVKYRSNISYFFRRTEHRYSGMLCGRCSAVKFLRFELTTLLLTWWGYVGIVVGPIYLFLNIKELTVALFNTRRAPAPDDA